jgi:hypothetical protein
MNTTVVTTQLDVFYQVFLRSFFDCNKVFFEFPRDHDLEMLISSTMRGSDSDAPDFGKESFEIEVPVQYYKEKSDVYILPPTALKLFIKRVKAFYWMEFHSEMTDLTNKGYENLDAVDFFRLKYRLPDDEKTIARLIKHFYRFRKKKYNLRYEKKKKKTGEKISA